MKLKQKIKLLEIEKRKYDIPTNVSQYEKIKLFFNVPIQKIIGYIDFSGIKIDLSKKVLIPRYETEELVFYLIKFIDQYKYKTALDLCSGSGFIGIALKKYRNELNICQADIDSRAIKQTKINYKINSIENTLIKSNMFSKLTNKKFDLIVSNPPYISKLERKTMDKSVLWYEPKKALFAKNKGLFFYEQIENEYKKFLNHNGLLFLEINPLNVEWFIVNNYQIIKDINGKERFAYKFNNN